MNENKLINEKINNVPIDWYVTNSWPTVYDVGPAVNQRWANDYVCLEGAWDRLHYQWAYLDAHRGIEAKLLYENMRKDM